MMTELLEEDQMTLIATRSIMIEPKILKPTISPFCSRSFSADHPVVNDGWCGTLRESSHGSLSLAASRSHSQQDDRYNKMGSLLAVLFPSLSLLSTELSCTKAHSRTV